VTVSIMRFAAVPALLWSCIAGALDVAESDVAAWIDHTSREHAIDSAWLSNLLADAEHQSSIVRAISRPAERTKPWHEYRDIFVVERRVREGAAFWREHRDTVEAIAGRHGIPPRLLVAILGVETNYGRTMGGYRVLDALATLSFGYPPRQDFFRRELTQFVLLAHDGQVDAASALGSYAGAMGAPQFMPSSYVAYAVDANGDGRRDLWQDWEDILGSIANYFAEHGWRPGQPVVARAGTGPALDPSSLPATRLELNHRIGELRAMGLEFDTPLDDEQPALLMHLDAEAGTEYWVGFRNFYVITRYNRSVLYAMAVNDLGKAIERRLAETS
jgi:membrane-bound lytic murein transglycosylase B